MYLKRAAALVEAELGKLPTEKAHVVAQPADGAITRQFSDQFPLRIAKAGGGTQTNVNTNEVIAP